MPKAPAKFASIFGHKEERELDGDDSKFLDPKQYIGVELECENAAAMAKLMHADSVHWSVVEDHSLRNQGWEFVLRQPLRGKQLAGAIQEFFDTAKNYKLEYNERTSCHLHFDCRDLTHKQFSALLIIYQAVEPAFWNIVSKSRRWSGYCLPMLESQGAAVEAIFKDRPNNNVIKGAITKVSRYSALNIQAISKHGSIEYRHFHNPATPDQLVNWINLTVAIKQAAMVLTDQSGKTALKAWVEENPERVVEIVRNNPILAEFTKTIDPATMVDAVDKMLGLLIEEQVAVPGALLLPVVHPLYLNRLGAMPVRIRREDPPTERAFGELKRLNRAHLKEAFVGLCREDLNDTGWVQSLSTYLGYVTPPGAPIGDGRERKARLTFCAPWLVEYCLEGNTLWPRLICWPFEGENIFHQRMESIVTRNITLRHAFNEMSEEQQNECVLYVTSFTWAVCHLFGRFTHDLTEIPRDLFLIEVEAQMTKYQEEVHRALFLGHLEQGVVNDMGEDELERDDDQPDRAVDPETVAEANQPRIRFYRPNGAVPHLIHNAVPLPGHDFDRWVVAHVANINNDNLADARVQLGADAGQPRLT